MFYFYLVGDLFLSFGKCRLAYLVDVLESSWPASSYLTGDATSSGISCLGLYLLTSLDEDIFMCMFLTLLSNYYLLH